TYATKLAVVGDIKASLGALLPLVAQKLAGRTEAYATLCEARGASRRPGARGLLRQPTRRSMHRSSLRSSPHARWLAPSVPRLRSSTKRSLPRFTCAAF